MPPSHQTSGRGGSADLPNSDLPTLKKGRNGWWQRNDINVVIGIVIVVFAIVVLWPSIFVTIPSGHAGVYFSLLFGGTDTQTVCGEGFWLKFPWDKIYDYDVRWQLVSYDYSVISADGLVLQFKVSVRARPRIGTLAYLQKDIGPEYLQKIVIPMTQQAIRQVVGDNSAEKTYTTSVSVLEEALDRVIEDLAGTYIVVDTINIRGVEIPAALKLAIESKLAQQQNSLQYDYVIIAAKKEAERKRIEAEGIRDFQNIVTPGISENFLRWKGIEATLDLAKSSNAKVVVVGAQNGLPLILDTSSSPVSAKANPSPLAPSPLLTPTPGQQFTVSPESSPSPLPTPLHDEQLTPPQMTPRNP
jgi:regulator of protease activity HflC (stomatin/prohibitin superfamily)